MCKQCYNISNSIDSDFISFSLAIRSTQIPEEVEPESTLKVFPNPNAGDILKVTFELNQEEEIDLSIQSIDGRISSRKILLKGKRSKGSYSDSFDISYLSTGVYIIILNTPTQQNYQKIITLSKARQVQK